MRLLLIRHAESVDNVAGVLAGTTDSPLSAHGAIQARRLGEHLASRRGDIGPVAHVFSSDLQRALDTARAITAAQTAEAGEKQPEIETLELLREKNFGSREGQSFRKRPLDEESPTGSGFVEAETQPQMAARMHTFYTDHLFPWISGVRLDRNQVVAVVAHGIILNVLVRALVERRAWPPAEASRLLRGGGDGKSQFTVLHNTGYIEIMMMCKSLDPGDQNRSVDLQVLSENNIDHLEGLKRTRGGIGSSKFDAKQKTMEAFFGPSSRQR